MKSYIYAHINPDTGEVLYIGQGSGPRAWDTYRRSTLHQTFMHNVAHQGYAPTQWAVILEAGLTPTEARGVELFLIQKMRPVFNQMGIIAVNAGRGTANKRAVLTEEIVRRMREEHADGRGTIRVLAARHGVTYCTARKAITGGGWSHVS